MSAWRVLRVAPKWDAACKPSSASTLVDVDRPSGVKKSKKAASAPAAVVTHSTAQLAEATAAMAAASEKKAVVMQDATYMQLFTIRLTDIDEDANEYIRLGRQLSLERLKARESASGNVRESAII